MATWQLYQYYILFRSFGKIQHNKIYHAFLKTSACNPLFPLVSPNGHRTGNIRRTMRVLGLNPRGTTLWMYFRLLFQGSGIMW